MDLVAPEGIPPAVEPEALVDPNRYPELGTRYRSIFIDTVVIVVMMWLATMLFSAWTTAPDGARMVAFILIWGVYEPACNTFACTLGNYIMKIRVRKAGDETRRIHIAQALVRYAVKLILGWLSFFTMGGNPRRRAIHDLASGSVVVYA